MNVNDLKKLLEEKKEVLLLDVREEAERKEEPYFDHPPKNYIAFPLPVLSILPLEELATRIRSEMEKLSFEEQKTKIVTLCRSGRRSEMACERLASLGFDTASLDGGYLAWKETR